MSGKKGKTTISDIATAAGVSKATVSRYINGRDGMSDQTRERIRAIIELTHYQPSEIARNLKRQHTNLIGVVVADMTSPFSSALIVSISEYLMKHDYVPVFASCYNNAELEKKTIEMMLAKGVAGLLVHKTSYDNDFLISVACSGVPVVLCERLVQNYAFDVVTIDNNMVMRKLLEHLKQQGYTRPCLFIQPVENNSGRLRRQEAFVHGVKTVYGYNPWDDIYVVSDLNVKSISKHIKHLKKKLPPREVPAIIGGNSITTVLTYKALNQTGYKIPEDIGICGTNDWDWHMDMSWPLLVEPNVTTIDMPVTEIGAKAAELLLQKIDNKSRETKEDNEIHLPCQLQVRSSTMRLPHAHHIIY